MPRPHGDRLGPCRIIEQVVFLFFPSNKYKYIGIEGGGVGFQSLNVSGHSDRDILQHNAKAALH